MNVLEYKPQLQVTPVTLVLPRGMRFKRLQVAPGITLQQAVGPLAEVITAQHKKLPIGPPQKTPTHLIVVDDARYLETLDRTLLAEGKQPDKDAPQLVMADSLNRQVLMTLTLLAGVAWNSYGTFTFEPKDVRPWSRRWTGYSHRETSHVSTHVEYVLQGRRSRTTEPARVRSLAKSLDRYYRSNYVWVDPISTALGYVWGALRSPDSALTFAGCTMALEALVATPRDEISHSLAERCALLTTSQGADPLERYAELKKLYNLRSTIVHGKCAPKRGPIRQDSIIVSAFYSNIPADRLGAMLNITLDTILAALAAPGYLKIVHTKQSDKQTTEALNQYFLRALLGVDTR